MFRSTKEPQNDNTQGTEDDRKRGGSDKVVFFNMLEGGIVERIVETAIIQELIIGSLAILA